jgi:hypothetical protein
MSDRKIHRCKNSPVLIVMDDGKLKCPFCYAKGLQYRDPMPGLIRNKLKFHRVIDPRGTLDYIGAQLMTNFLVNGMTISDVARQMGITRSTIYDRLRKYDLIEPDDDHKPCLQPTISDVVRAGGTKQRIKVKSVTAIKAKLERPEK